MLCYVLAKDKNAHNFYTVLIAQDYYHCRKEIHNTLYEYANNALDFTSTYYIVGANNFEEAVKKAKIIEKWPANKELKKYDLRYYKWKIRQLLGLCRTLRIYLKKNIKIVYSRGMYATHGKI